MPQDGEEMEEEEEQWCSGGEAGVMEGSSFSIMVVMWSCSSGPLRTCVFVTIFSLCMCEFNQRAHVYLWQRSLNASLQNVLVFFFFF